MTREANFAGQFFFPSPHFPKALELRKSFSGFLIRTIRGKTVSLWISNQWAVFTLYLSFFRCWFVWGRVQRLLQTSSSSARVVGRWSPLPMACDCTWALSYGYCVRAGGPLEPLLPGNYVITMNPPKEGSTSKQCSPPLGYLRKRSGLSSHHSERKIPKHDGGTFAKAELTVIRLEKSFIPTTDVNLFFQWPHEIYFLLHK